MRACPPGGPKLQVIVFWLDMTTCVVKCLLSLSGNLTLKNHPSHEFIGSCLLYSFIIEKNR